MHATVNLAPAYSFGNKHCSRNKAKSPGPAAYTLPSTINNNGKNVRIGQRFKEKTVDVTPAPVAYDSSTSWSKVASKSPTFSFGRRFKRPSGDKTPGSGEYTPNVTNVLNKSPSFSMRRRVQLKNNMGRAPGPAAYGTHNTWTNVKKAAPSYSMKARYKDPKRMSTPGPNAYRPTRPLQAAPKYSMRPRTGGSRGKALGPGPAAYNLGSQFGYRK